jgi:hypothetical protein
VSSTRPHRWATPPPTWGRRPDVQAPPLIATEGSPPLIEDEAHRHRGKGR